MVSNSETESSDSDEYPPLLSTSEKDSRKATSHSSNDPRFNQPKPSPLKRLSLILFLLFLFWAGFKLRASLLEAKRNPNIIHATRYSKEFKFRPAASPIITETLKDGRIRLRGALPGPAASPTDAVLPKKKSRKKRKQKESKRKRTDI